MNNLISEAKLRELYIDQNLPMQAIADELGISVGSVYNYIHMYDIPARERHKGMKGKHHSLESLEKIKKKNKGKTVSKESRMKISQSKKVGGIGHKKKRSDGYIKIYFPDHPCSASDGYIMEHVLVMEALIGRHLYDYECVHHKNRNRSDNRKENLELMTKKEHMSYHSKMRWEEKKGE